jgi:hypothetical protein
MSTRPTLPITHGRVAVSGPRRAPTNTITTRSRPAPTMQSRETAHRAAGPPARNFSRVQPAGSATTNAARPTAGIENWGHRLESVQALPLPAATAGIVRSYQRSAPSLVREDDESGVLSARPSTASTRTASERHAAVVRVDENRARRQPVRVCATPIRSHAGSLVAATERGPSRAATFRPCLAEAVAATERGQARTAVRFSPMRPRQQQAPLPPSSLRNVLTSAGESSSTRLPPQVGAQAGWGGVNYSPYGAGTIPADIQRRKELARKFPLPVNAVGDDARERKFASPAGGFVDVPVLGARRGQTLMQECEVRLSVHRRAEEAGEARKGMVVAQDGEKTAEKKKGALRRLGGFLGRKLKRKAKTASSSSSESPSSVSSPASPPSLVYGSSSSGTPSPPTPVQRRPEPAVVVVGAPARQVVPLTSRQGDTRRFVSQAATPIPVRQVPQQASTLVSPARARNNDALAQAAAAVSALPLQRTPYDESLRYHHSASSSAHEQLSDLEEADAELFTTPLNATKRWAPRAESSCAAVLREEAHLHASLEGVFATEEAAVVNQSGPYELVRQAQAELVAYVGKGKGRTVDVSPPVPTVSLQNRTRAETAQRPQPQSGHEECGFGPERKDTVEEEEEKVA